jgi:O-antigen/teichoic acid export membrane protein
MAHADSLKIRYSFKLLTSLIGLFINMVTQMIIPRGLGPQAYGDFHYLTKAFTSVVIFLDMGTSTAFYTKLSQNNKDRGLISFYTLYVVLVIIAILLFVGVLQWTGIIPLFFLNQELKYIYLAAFWGINFWLAHFATRMGDAFGLTVPIEKAKILQKFIGLFLILGFYVTNSFSLTIFFIYHYSILLFLIGTIFVIILRAGFLELPLKRLDSSSLHDYSDQFIRFVRPLVLYTLVSVAAGMADRWLLQNFAGSTQQGFFSLATQISALCLLFSSAMTALLHREFATTFAENNMAEMAQLFRRYLPLFYFLTAFISCFISIHAYNVSYIIGGEEFIEAQSAVIIMALFSIHASYGQLTSGIFYATGQTKLLLDVQVFDA